MTKRAYITKSVDKMRDLTPNAVRVLCHLGQRANKALECWPSTQTVGDVCFTSITDKPRTRKLLARKALAELEVHGLIERTVRHTAVGARTSDMFRLVEEGMGPSTRPAPRPSTRTGERPSTRRAPGRPHGPEVSTIELTTTTTTVAAAVEAIAQPVIPVVSMGDGADRAVPTLDAIPAAPDGFARVAQAYCDEVGGSLTPMVRDMLVYDVEEYGGDWILDALREMAAQGKRSYKYAQSILKRWKREGREGKHDSKPAPVVAPRVLMVRDWDTDEWREVVL